MIYLFNDVKKLTGTVKTNHYRTLLHEREKNGLYTTSVEVPVTYNDKGTVYNYDKKIRDNDFIGYYDKEGRFQLHKIAAYDIEDNFIKIKGIHVFFDEAKAGAIIKDRRFIDREVVDGAIAAFDTIGWQVVDHDVSVKKNYNFYNVSPLEALAILQETFEFEFDYWLTFDGKKVTGKSIAVKEKLGKKRPDKRYVYGHNVLSIRAEQDYSEVYTAVIGRGKGEEITETGGYGRRIEFTDVVWGDNKPLRKPAGSRMLEDENATRLFGYKENGVVKPRIKVEVFSDIESPTELLQASYEWLMANNTPKAVFSLKVPDGDGLDLGDEVYVIYRDIDLVKTARVEKVIDDLKSGRRDVEFGDTAYFNVDRRMKSIENNLKRVGEGQGGAIYNLKKQFDERFNQMVSDYRDEFEQAKIDILAEVEADRARMEAEFNQTIDTWTNKFNQDVENAMKYAEEQAKAHSDAVESKLDTVTGSHAGMLADLQSDVMDIDEFIGQRDKTLQQILDEERQKLEEKIEIFNKNYPNLVVGSTLENIDGFEPYQTSEFELRTEESLNYIRTYDVEGRSVQAYLFPDIVYLEQGNTYTIGVDFRSDSVEDLDYIYFMGPNNNVALTPLAQTRGLTADGKWHRYYFTFDWINTTRQARLMIGTDFKQGDTTRGWFDTRQVHLYKGDTHNIPWTPSPSDNAQVVSQLLYEMRQLEDGMKTLATKTDLDLVTGRVEQFTNEFTSTSEQLSSKLQNFDDVLGTNGSHFTQIAEQVQSKVWLNDVKEINPNLIPFSDFSDDENRLYWDYWNSTIRWVDNDGYLVVRNPSSSTSIGMKSKTFDVIEGESYTISWVALINRNATDFFRYTYITYDDYPNQFLGSHRSYELENGVKLYENTFVANHTGKARILIGTRTNGNNLDVEFRFKEPKLERGTERTPFLNAFSNIEQLANKIALQVQELDGEFLTQSDIQVKAGYVQIGSQQIGDEQFASIFRVSPKSIDAITDNLNLTGNLNVKGQITSLAVDAIEGRFSDLFTSHLTANIITADHLSVGTAMIDKLFATSGRIDQLITKDHFVRNMKALSIEAVEGNFSSLMTKYLSANYIDVDYIDGKDAWFESMYTSNAMIRRLTAQHAFIRDVQAIEITANQLNLDTLRNRFNQIEGGLHITRAKDGVRWIENGVPRGNVPVQTYDSYAGSNIRFNGLNYITDYSHWQTFKYFYTPHEGRILRVVWAVGLFGSSGSASEYVEVQVNGFGNNNQINNGAGSSSRRVYVSRGKTVNITQDIPLPPPNYNMMQAYLQVRRSPSGTGVTNDVFARILHIGQYG